MKKIFKICTLVFAIALYLSAFVFALKPEPFLKFGYPGIFVFNLFGPGMFLIPALARNFNVGWVAFFTALGMAFNDAVSWLAGKNGDIVLPRGKRVKSIEKYIKRYGPFALFFWAIIPFPYDFIAIIAGYLGVPFWRFLIPTFLGRLIRFLLMGSGVVAIWGKINMLN